MEVKPWDGWVTMKSSQVYGFRDHWCQIVEVGTLEGMTWKYLWNKKLTVSLKLNLKKRTLKITYFCCMAGEKGVFQIWLQLILYQDIHADILGQTLKLRNYFFVFTHKRRWVRKQNWILGDCSIPPNFTALLQFNWQARIAGMSFHWTTKPNRRR